MLVVVPIFDVAIVVVVARGVIEIYTPVDNGCNQAKLKFIVEGNAYAYLIGSSVFSVLTI